VQLWVAVTEQLPGGEYALKQLARAERIVSRELAGRLADQPPDAGPPIEASPAVPALPSPGDVLRTLMDQSMYTSPDESRVLLHRDLLLALLPDEARILAALSDGSRYPVMHVAEPGADGEPVLANASTIGRASGVALPQHTPTYLARMLQLGLVRIGPEAQSMRDDYEMLLTDPAVNSALTSARRSFRGARVLRHTITITELGQEVWEAAK
jgi:hypothetical protein